MRSRFWFIKLLCGLLSAGSACAYPAGSPSDVLERSIGVMGGFEAFARLRVARIDFTAESRGGPLPASGGSQHVRFPHTMVWDMRSDDGDGPVRYEGMRVSTIDDDGNARPVDPATRDRYRAAYWREWWVLYARYAWHGLGEVWIDARTPEDIDGRRYHVLRVQPRDAGEFDLYVDAETLEPTRLTYNDGSQRVTEVFDDFRDIDGIRFPTTISIRLAGRPAWLVRYHDVEFERDDEPLTLERRLDAILSASIAEKRIPGMTAVIARGDRTIFAKAYGLESVELGVPATLDSVFPLASVSKMFAATTAMRLVERGELDLDASIRRYLDFVPEAYADITVRHLLNHSHGLADALSDNPGRGLPMRADEEGTRESRLAWALGEPPKFEPGEGWAYSITGYEVLQAVLEVVSGVDYETLAAREIFEPLGLGSAQYGGSDRIVEGRAPMDYIWIDGVLTYNYLNYPRAIYTSAGLNATAPDVLRFFRAVAGGDLVTESSRDAMWREVILDTGEPTYYGLGWGSFRTTRDDRWSIGHSGGGSSWTRYFPDSDVTVIVLSNLNGAREDKLVYDLATAVEQAEMLSR